MHSTRLAHSLIITVSILFGGGASLSASDSDGGPTVARTEKTVLELDRAWGQAYVTGDFNVIERILDPDWHGWLDNKSSDKESELSDFKAGHSASLENIIDNARVRVYGDAAVVEGRERVRYRDDSGEHWLTWHITDVFIRRAGQWRVVASHCSTIPNP